MTRLYVANCTRQNHELYYRLDFTPKGSPEIAFRPANKQPVAPGRQVVIGNKDLHLQQVESICGQLGKYGMVGVAEVPRVRGKIPFVFNVDRPVPADTIRYVMDLNAGLLTQEGIDRRARAAVASNELITQAVSNEFAAKGIEIEPTPAVEVEFEQEEQSEAGEKRIEEGYRISAAAPASGRPSSGKPSSGRAKRGSRPRA
jgi:hypothetical protein